MAVIDPRCDCPPRWDRNQLIPCDHELERLELWHERYDEWWNE